MNFNCINHFSARLEVSTKNINYKGFTLAHFVLTQFLICKRSLPITIFLIGLNLSVVSCRRLASDLADSPRCLPIMYEIYQCFLRSVERASLYNLVNETNLVHCLFLLYSSILFLTSTCFGPLQVHHQEERLYLCDTWYLLFCKVDCLVCIPDNQLYSITSRG